MKWGIVMLFKYLHSLRKRFIHRCWKFFFCFQMSTNQWEKFISFPSAGARTWMRIIREFNILNSIQQLVWFLSLQQMERVNVLIYWQHDDCVLTAQNSCFIWLSSSFWEVIFRFYKTVKQGKYLPWITDHVVLSLFGLDLNNLYVEPCTLHLEWIYLTVA